MLIYIGHKLNYNQTWFYGILISGGVKIVREAPVRAPQCRQIEKVYTTPIKSYQTVDAVQANGLSRSAGPT